MTDLVDWVIKPEDQAAFDQSVQDGGTPYEGAWHVSSDVGIGASVVPGGSIRMRRAMGASGVGEFARWLIIELEGVRTYVVLRQGFLHLLVTKEDLYPSQADEEQTTVNGQSS